MASLKNTAENYGTIAKTFHWLIALLFLASYCSVYYRQWFTEDKTPENWTALQLHLSVGVTIAALVVLRIVWKLMNKQPHDEPGSALATRAKHTGHYLLYAVMILMPITGYLGTGANTEYFFLFEIPKFETTAAFQSLIAEGMDLTFKQFEKPIDFFHKEIMGKYLVWMLIVGHAGAALYHHYKLKDRTLIKMTTGQ